MNVHLDRLFERALPALQGHARGAAQELIDDPSAELIDDQPTREGLQDLLATLQARSINASRKNMQIVGLDQLIRKLQDLPHSTQVLGYGFSSPDVSGIVYFAAAGNTPLGVTIVRHRVGH